MRLSHLLAAVAIASAGCSSMKPLHTDMQHLAPKRCSLHGSLPEAWQAPDGSVIVACHDKRCRASKSMHFHARLEDAVREWNKNAKLESKARAYK